MQNKILENINEGQTNLLGDMLAYVDAVFSYKNLIASDPTISEKNDDDDVIEFNKYEGKKTLARLNNRALC